MIYLITYDLHKPDRDYKDVIATIQSFGSWAHDEESVWLVDTHFTTEQCLDALMKTSGEATYFVARLSGDWGSYGVHSEVTAWLNDRSRNW